MPKRNGRTAAAAPHDKKKTRPWGRPEHEGLLLDLHQGATLLGRLESELRHWVERKSIPFRRIGGRVMFVRSELLAFIGTAPGCSMKEAVANAGREQEAGRP